WWERTLDPALRRVALVSIGLLRTAEAVDFLLERVRTDAEGPASDAVEALAVVAHDPAVRARIVEAAAANPRTRSDVVLARLPDEGAAPGAAARPPCPAPAGASTPTAAGAGSARHDRTVGSGQLCGVSRRRTASPSRTSSTVVPGTRRASPVRPRRAVPRS